MSFKKAIKKVRDTIIWLPKIKKYQKMVKRGEEVVFSECYLKFNGTQFIHNNWGDDLNFYFFSYVTDKQFAFIPYSKLLVKPEHRYTLIGSIIGFFDLNDTIIYGSGLKHLGKPTIGVPEKIISVRGPLTRNELIKRGFDCPEKYGDPALLIPLFYTPNDNQAKKITVIPHYWTLREKKKEYFFGSDNIHVLDMEHYNEWTDIVDSIYNSQLVISESLHGLIVAEAFGIPSVWVEFVEHDDNWSFKFEDFYSSIGKEKISSLKLFDGNIEPALIYRDSWKPGTIDFSELLHTFPFEYNTKLLKNELLTNVKD